MGFGRTYSGHGVGAGFSPPDGAGFSLRSGLPARAINAVLALAIAPACAACRSILESPLDGAVCRACWDGVVTGALSWHPPSATPLDAVLSAGPYDGLLRDIIHVWKFERRQSLARPLAAIVRRECAEVIDSADIIAPVPMTPWRKWRRGFNQADDLARRLGGSRAQPLARWRPRPAQSSLPSELRRHNLEQSIFVLPHKRRHVLGRIVVLVDDVITTGATLEACAAALKHAGAKEVRAVTVAQTLLRAARAA